MDTILTDLEKGLTTQLSTLADEIRLGEEKLMRNKEGYLKVQGALEILTVIKKQQSEKSEKELKEALTTAGLD